MIHTPIQCNKNHYKSRKKMYPFTFGSSLSYDGCAWSTGAHVSKYELCQKGVCILFQIMIPEHGVISHSAVCSGAPSSSEREKDSQLWSAIL